MDLAISGAGACAAVPPVGEHPAAATRIAPKVASRRPVSALIASTDYKHAPSAPNVTATRVSTRAGDRYLLAVDNRPSSNRQSQDTSSSKR